MTDAPLPDAAATSWLRHADLLVRPPGEPLPTPLREHPGALSKVFRHWLRQRDDAAHAADKALLTRALESVSAAAVDQAARRQASIALAGGWGHWCWSVPSATVAALLGLPMSHVADQQVLHRRLRAMAEGLGAQASAAQVEAANDAMSALLAALNVDDARLAEQAETCRRDSLDDWDRVRDRIGDRAQDRSNDQASHHAINRVSLQPAGGAFIARALQQHAPAAAWSSPSALAANRLALLWQSHEAGAALLGHALMAGESTVEGLIRLARAGGGVRITRRFARCPMSGPQGPMDAGDALIVPLQEHPFGDGPHHCPGAAIALQTIASAIAAVQAMPTLRRPVALDPLILPNAQIPQFADAPLPFDLEPCP